MKQLKVLHLGDLHIDHDPKFKNKIKSSLDQVISYCQEIKINAVIIPGDIWHRKQSYSNLSGVPFALEFFHKLARLVDFVFITKGNHDDLGSIELLHQIDKNVYAYEYPVVLAVGSYGAIDILRPSLVNHSVENTDYIVTLVPYPTKASLLIEDSIDNNNANFLDKFEQIFEHIGDILSDYNCPAILGFHGNISGSRLSTGQTLMGQDIIVSPSTLEKAKQDYYALNHIHLYQEIKPNMFYAGGVANFNWGETEPKSFQVVTFEDNEMKVERIMLTSARPMVTIDAELINGEFVWDKSLLNEETKNAEFRFRCKVKENERNLITDDSIYYLQTLFGNDVKTEFNIVPVERTARSENIMSSRSLIDEVIEYANVIGESINGAIHQKVSELQEKLL